MRLHNRLRYAPEQQIEISIRARKDKSKHTCSKTNAHTWWRWDLYTYLSDRVCNAAPDVRKSVLTLLVRMIRRQWLERMSQNLANRVPVPPPYVGYTIYHCLRNAHEPVNRLSEVIITYRRKFGYTEAARWTPNWLMSGMRS